MLLKVHRYLWALALLCFGLEMLENRQKAVKRGLPTRRGTLSPSRIPAPLACSDLEIDRLMAHKFDDNIVSMIDLFVHKPSGCAAALSCLSTDVFPPVDQWMFL